MADNEEVVTQPDSTTSEEVVSEPQVDSTTDVAAKDEERIPHSRVEEMYKRRLEKAQREWAEKELSPMKTKLSQYEDVLGKVAKGQLGFLKELGLYKDEPPKPVTQEDLEKSLNERLTKFEEAQRYQYYQERIRSGWETVTTKFPKFAGNKRFQDAVLYSYSQNPDIPIAQHAEAYVKELLEPYANERASTLAKKREDELRPSNRVVPSGRGAAGASTGKSEPKKGVAERIMGALKARNEG